MSPERSDPDPCGQLQKAVHAYRQQFGAEAAQRLRRDLDGLLPLVEVATAPSAANPSAKEGQYRASFPDMIGRSAGMRALFDLLLKVAPTDATVLIHGESGTGKELVARSLHDLSRRKSEAFVAENCAALPETLLESELFGHTRGAFTGAVANRRGRFAVADRGTLFLDEVGDMSPGMQKKLLRALQEGEIRPVGATAYKKVDVRFVSASNKDLLKLVEQGLFREDLYWRLSPIRVDIPPLRERAGDVALLVHAIGAGIAKHMGRNPPQFSVAAMAALGAYRWPGNVRELQNELQRSLALTPVDQIIDLGDLSAEVAGG